MYVLDTVSRFIYATRHSTAGTLVSRIGGNGDVTLFGKALRIQSGNLLFYAAIRMCHNDSRVFFSGIVVSRGIDIRGNLDAMEIVFHRMNVDLTFDVLSDGTVINQREGIFFVIGRIG